jgi:hypothetical protein
MEKNTEPAAIAAACAAAIWTTRAVNICGRNIFNGLLRVPVKKKIPALNLI